MIREIIERYGETLARAPLFEGLDGEGLARLLAAAGAALERRKKGEYFIMQGDDEPDIFVMVEGRAAGETLTVDGGSRVINEFKPGDEFGDLLSGSREKSPVSVAALVESAAVRVSFERLLSADGAAPERARVVRNLVAVAAEKYFSLSRRVALLLEPRVRKRAAAYLLSLADAVKGNRLSVPFDREGMAGYLGCERSALSRELSRMRAEGLIDYKKNAFEILSRERLKGQLL